MLTGLFLFLSCMNIPLMINDVKVVESGDLYLAWTTNIEARCKVAYCLDDKCTISGLEPAYGKLHAFSLPANAKGITIVAEGNNNEIVIMGVKP